MIKYNHKLNNNQNMKKDKVYKVAEYVQINPDLFDVNSDQELLENQIISLCAGENVNMIESKNLESIAFIFSKIWKTSNELIYSLKNNSILIYTYSSDLIRPDNVNYFLYKDLSKTEKELSRIIGEQEKSNESLKINLEKLWNELGFTEFKDIYEKMKKFIDSFVSNIKKSETIVFNGEVPGFLLLIILQLSIQCSNNIYYKNIKVK